MRDISIETRDLESACGAASGKISQLTHSFYHSKERITTSLHHLVSWAALESRRQHHGIHILQSSRKSDKEGTMGSGRKRPLDRAPAPSKGDVEGRKKKKGKKSKEKKETTTSEQTHKTSFESTATAEGKMMAQVCSTFNRLEQSRFEAFRRAAFPGDAISKYVAHCLIEEHGGGQGPTRRSPILSEVSAPGQADEICIVVSTLAKAYAQRLVTASRRLANNSSSDEPIQPEHILQAFHDRQAAGLDPGFFLQAAPSSTKVLLKDDVYKRKRLAALKAQEDYDKLYPPLATEENDGDDAMDISSTSKIPI